MHPEVMIPLTSHVNELKRQQTVLEAEAKVVMKEQGVEVDYKFGTMIEIPRAALTAREIAEYAQFFSFGTNDLTQTTFGISREPVRLDRRIGGRQTHAVGRRGRPGRPPGPRGGHLR